MDGEGSNAGTGNGPWATSSSNWVYESVAGGDAHKGSDPGDQNLITPIEQWNATAANGYLDQIWQQRYDGVQRSNEALRVMKLAKDISAADVTRITAEARFLRGHYHFDLIKIFKNIPFIDETVTYSAGNFLVANDGTAMAKIEADFAYAYANLPATMSNVGRANKWAAAAYLAKVYMFEKKFAEARALYTTIIANGTTSLGVKYALLPKFGDVFNAANKNSSEDVFSVQMTANDGTGAANANSGDALNFPYGGETGCCGFFQPSFTLANSFEVDANGLPFLNNGYVALKSDMGIAADKAFTPDSTTPMDPRVDWTVGRRGVPYLDWGIMPGSTWVRNQAAAGPYEPLKHLFRKSQEGTFTDGSSWTNGFTANNYHLIRYADVLLMAAEAEIQGGGTVAQAMIYVNQIRSRAANKDGYVGPANNAGLVSPTKYSIGLYTASTFTAANAMTAIMFERKIELAMEGHRFSDLVRWGTAKAELDAYAKAETAQGYTSMSGVTFTTGKSEYLPIPQAQVDKSVKAGKSVLTQNPGY